MWAVRQKKVFELSSLSDSTCDCGKRHPTKKDAEACAKRKLPQPPKDLQRFSGSSSLAKIWARCLPGGNIFLSGNNPSPKDLERLKLWLVSADKYKERLKKRIAD